MKIDYFVVVTVFIVGLIFAFLGFLLASVEGATTAVVLYIGSMVLGKLCYSE